MQGNLHNIDSETESDEEIYVTTGLGKKVPSEIEIATSKKKLTGLKPTEIVVVPTKHEGQEPREDAFKRKRRKSEKEN